MISSKDQKLLDRHIELARDEVFQTKISIDQVINAQQLMSERIYSEADVLYVVSAINLLNAAKKRDEFKSLVSYREIKGNITRLLTYLATLDRKRFDIDFFINAEEKCAYIKVYGIQFSFHEIRITPILQQFIASAQNKVKPWEGVRLQRIAGEIFAFAVKVKISHGFYN